MAKIRCTGAAPAKDADPKTNHPKTNNSEASR